MKKAVVVIFEDFEEIEAIACIDILRRAGIETVIATLNNSLETKGRSGIRILGEKYLGDIDDSFDALVISGGGGIFKVSDSDLLKKVVQRYARFERLVCAICAAPIALKKAGILDGIECTSYPSISDEFDRYNKVSEVVVDRNIITSQGAGTAIRFALEIVKNLLGEKISVEIAKSICFKF